MEKMKINLYKIRHTTKYILQSGRGGFRAEALASSFRPRGQERAPKSAPQHVPTVMWHNEKYDKKMKYNLSSIGIDFSFSLWES